MGDIFRRSARFRQGISTISMQRFCNNCFRMSAPSIRTPGTPGAVQSKGAPPLWRGSFSVVGPGVVYTLLVGLDDPLGVSEKPAPVVVGVRPVAELEGLAAAVDAVVRAVGFVSRRSPPIRSRARSSATEYRGGTRPECGNL